jgi:two-component system cell cycle sensor histidine kinase/response regulator CckA
MTLDNRKFIERHYKQETLEAPPPKRAKKRSWSVIGAAVLFLVIASLFIAFILVENKADTPHLDLIAALGALTTIVGGVVLLGAIRKKAGKELNYDMIYEVLEGSRGARLMTDSADNTIYYNKKFERLCRGVGPPALKSLTRLFENHEDSAEHFKSLSDQAHKGTTGSIDLFSKFEDVERWFQVTAQPVSGYPGYLHWRVDDVTQQHTVDKAIREEREKLIDFTDNAPVGFFSVDEKGAFVFANATFARWVGEDLRTLLNGAVLHTYLMDPPEGGNPYDLTEESRPRQVVELKMKGPGGKSFLASINQVVVIEDDGKVRTRAVVRDLTAEREMRKALEASEDRFQRFFEEAPLGIIQVDDDGQISDSNTAFASMIGAPVSKIERTPFEELLSEEDHEKVMMEIGRIGSGKAEEESALEVTLQHKEGRKVMTQMYARKLRDGQHIMLHFIDVTEQKSLEAQFVQSQKMQAIGQLAGGVAHDFNNLLTAMIGFCDLLLLRHKPGDPSFSDIMQIKQNSNRASNLVRQLLAFSRQQTLRPKVQDITDILTELSHLLRRLIGAGIELELVHGDNLNLVKVDEGQMEQVLINMAVNARDAMDNVGRLTITTENFTNRKPLELLSEEMPPGHWTLIKITDTGSGISKENLSHIFEPFFTTKKVGEGTGLGLATVYGIIRQTDGFLDVKTKEGEGTTFYIYLPRASEADIADEAPVEAEHQTQAQDLTGSECIVLVEDEDAVRTFSERALANKGYEVISAPCGDDAWEMFEKEEVKRLDLLVTDVVMPGMDGPTLAQKVLEKYPDLKVIFMSGYTEDKLKDHMGPNIFFLPKPFTLNQLAEKIKTVLKD